MKPRTDAVRQFIEIYDVIRTDKTGPLSRRDLDWTYLADRFDVIFELSKIDGQLIMSQVSPKLATALALRSDRNRLQEFLSQTLCDEVSALFEELLSSSNRGVLAEFRTAPGLPVREYELVLLPAAADGSTSAICTIGAVTGRPANDVDIEAERKLIASLCLQDEACFDLRQGLMSRMGAMLVQCMVSLKKMLPGRKLDS